LKSKKRTHPRPPGRILKLGNAPATFGLTLALALVAAALLTNTCYRQYTLTGAYAREYEGKILNKSQTITESETGSGVRRRLLIEGRNGQRFEVAIGEETYERARKGMWIKKTEASGVELTWPGTAVESPTP
jgi:hypothetical protein